MPKMENQDYLLYLDPKCVFGHQQGVLHMFAVTFIYKNKGDSKHIQRTFLLLLFTTTTILLGGLT